MGFFRLRRKSDRCRFRVRVRQRPFRMTPFKFDRAGSMQSFEARHFHGAAAFHIDQSLRLWLRKLTRSHSHELGRRIDDRRRAAHKFRHYNKQVLKK